MESYDALLINGNLVRMTLPLNKGSNVVVDDVQGAIQSLKTYGK
jgi:hypothetical protein